MNPQDLVGDIIDDKYTVLSVIGTGGMGCVLKANQGGLNRHVAIKLLHPWFARDSESLVRFEREAQALSTLSHKHIGAFYQYGIWHPYFDSSEMPFIAMEYLEGSSLLALIQESGRLPWRRTLYIAMQVLEAMEFVHAAGVLHRDLKPSNIVLLDSPEPDFVKVVDFGLAKLVGNDSSVQKLTQTGELVGTVQYMSPELCTGHKADQRSDIYSLAAVLYECLAGKPPHSAENPVGIIYMHGHVEPALPSTFLDQKLPTGLDEVIMKALSKNPDLRYQTMTDLKEDLFKIMQERGEECLAVLHLRPRSKKAGSKTALIIVLASCVLLIASTLFLTCTGTGLSLLAQKFADKLSTKQLTSIVCRLEDLHCQNEAEELRTQIFLNHSASGNVCSQANLCLGFAGDLKHRDINALTVGWLHKGFELLASSYASKSGKLDDCELKALNDLCDICKEIGPAGLSKLSDVFLRLQHPFADKNWENFMKLRYDMARARHDTNDMCNMGHTLSAYWVKSGRVAEGLKLQAEVRRLLRDRYGDGPIYMDYLIRQCGILEQSGEEVYARSLFAELMRVFLYSESSRQNIRNCASLLGLAENLGNSQQVNYINGLLAKLVDFKNNAWIDDRSFGAVALTRLYRKEKRFSQIETLIQPFLIGAGGCGGSRIISGKGFYFYSLIYEYINSLFDQQKYGRAISVLKEQLIEPKELEFANAPVAVDGKAMVKRINGSSDWAMTQEEAVYQKRLRVCWVDCWRNLSKSLFVELLRCKKDGKLEVYRELLDYFKRSIMVELSSQEPDPSFLADNVQKMSSLGEKQLAFELDSCVMQKLPTPALKIYLSSKAEIPRKAGN